MEKVTNNQGKIQEEKNLVVLMQTGTETEKQNAFNKLYKAHASALTYKVMTAFKMDKELARDLVQEIFMRVFLHINTYTPTHAFSTWLYKIATNHIIDSKRKQNYDILNFEVLQVGPNESDESSGGLGFQLEDKSADNHELLVRQERANMVHGALRSIKHKGARKVATSFFIEDRSHEDISKEMELPVGTVKALIFRAKEMMRNYLVEKHPEFEYGNICTTKFRTIREVEASEG